MERTTQRGGERSGPDRPASAGRGAAAGSRPAKVLALQERAGNRAVVSLMRQVGRGATAGAAPAAATTVTRVIVVTSNDTAQQQVQDDQGRVVGRIPQQEIWNRLAAQIAGTAAPEGGRTAVLHVSSADELQSRLAAIAGGRVSRLDFIGHGQPHGFNLRGIQSAPNEWLTPADVGRIVAESRIAVNAASFEVNYRACYTDVIVDRTVAALRSNGVRAPRANGVTGAFEPRYGPPGPVRGTPNISDRRNWVVRAAEPDRRSGQPPPRLDPADLRGL